MKPSRPNPDSAPSPEQLAAYADGELDAVAQARIGAWLTEHPEAVAELEAQRQIGRLFESLPPPEPSDREWNATLDRVHAEVSRPVPRPAAPRRTLRFAVVAGVAAAVIVALMLYHRAEERPAPGPLPAPVVQVAETPFAVASDKDVEIVSMDAGDIDAVVVGTLPLRGPLVLVAPGDVSLESFAMDEGMPPPKPMGMNDGVDAPMFLVPLGLAQRGPLTHRAEEETPVIPTSTRLPFAALLAALVSCLAAAPVAADDVRVTVLAILATDKNAKVDAKLADIAERVQSKEPKLTGFRLGVTTSTNVQIGAATAFPLVENQEATVTIKGTVKKDKEKDNCPDKPKIKLTVKAPGVNQITYTTCCDKYFPIVTAYETKNKERLIIAVMVEHCKSK